MLKVDYRTQGKGKQTQSQNKCTSKYHGIQRQMGRRLFHTLRHQNVVLVTTVDSYQLCIRYAGMDYV